MQTKFSDGSVGVAGKVTKDAEFKTVGDKQSHITTFSIIAGKRKDTTTIFVNCKAWHGLADYARQIKKGDHVFVIGQIESREYNGKTYEDVNCEWIGVVGKEQATFSAPYQGVVIDEIPDEDGSGDFPFA
jgi:single-stranded DNA-binding protein